MSSENGKSRAYLLFVWSPTGYSLRELEGDPPAVGSELEDGGRTLVVTKVGPSPFPADPRPCVFSLGRS
jgi:hypothetical protein